MSNVEHKILKALLASYTGQGHKLNFSYATNNGQNVGLVAGKPHFA